MHYMPIYLFPNVGTFKKQSPVEEVNYFRFWPNIAGWFSSKSTLVVNPWSVRIVAPFGSRMHRIRGVTIFAMHFRRGYFLPKSLKMSWRVDCFPWPSTPTSCRNVWRSPVWSAGERKKRICTSGSRPSSLISHWPRQTAVFRSVQSCCWTLIYFLFYGAICNFLINLTNRSVRISPVVLLDIENIGIAVGMLLRSCVQAELYVISYLFPVSGHHL